MFDNGNDRVFPSGVTCSSCQYSTVPLLDLDETAMTATLTWNPTAPHYSFFGGNAAVLKNGNVEYCESAEPTGTTGDIYEVTQAGASQTVWHMQIAGQYAYWGDASRACIPEFSGEA